MFYWHILQKDRNELLYKFYLAQKLKPTTKDWVTQIEKDKKDLNLLIDDEEVSKMSKYACKQKVQNKIHKFATRNFQAIQSKQSKTSKLEIHEKIKPAKYFFLQRIYVKKKYKLCSNFVLEQLM